jgi:hypothetical protein
MGKLMFAKFATNVSEQRAIIRSFEAQCNESSTLRTLFSQDNLPRVLLSSGEERSRESPRFGSRNMVVSDPWT